MVAAFYERLEIGAIVEVQEVRVDGSRTTAMCRIIGPATLDEYIASERERGLTAELEHPASYAKRPVRFYRVLGD